jgi:hypothetical protein
MASVHQIIPEPWIFKDKKMAEIDQTEARLNTHEEVCALRYEGICARLKRLENIGVAVAGAIILMLISILVKMN